MFIYYLLFLTVLTFIPFIVYRYIMAGDEYLIASNQFYPILWIIGLTFLICYFFTFIKNSYQCLYLSKQNVDLTDKVNTIFVGTIHSSLYITTLAFAGYVIGSTLLDTVPKLKDLFMAVVHIPLLEYVIKGVPLSLGAILGNLLTLACISTSC